MWSGSTSVSVINMGAINLQYPGGKGGGGLKGHQWIRGNPT